jgi:hypothetical protein
MGAAAEGRSAAGSEQTRVTPWSEQLERENYMPLQMTRCAAGAEAGAQRAGPASFVPIYFAQASLSI